jgi:hypothetical protein
VRMARCRRIVIASIYPAPILSIENPKSLNFKSLCQVHRSVTDSAIHLTASIIRETGSILSRMRSTGFAGVSGARVLDRVDPLATLAAKRCMIITQRESFAKRAFVRLDTGRRVKNLYERIWAIC